jgi:hypothetical protein
MDNPTSHQAAARANEAPYNTILEPTWNSGAVRLPHELPMQRPAAAIAPRLLSRPPATRQAKRSGGEGVTAEDGFHSSHLGTAERAWHPL